MVSHPFCEALPQHASPFLPTIACPLGQKSV